MLKTIRLYSDLQKLTTFKQRYDYLRLTGTVGIATFGFDRYLNQILYTSKAWRSARDQVITRDDGCDLGVAGYDIHSRLIVHHMNPINVEDISRRNPDLFNPEFLVCVTHNTHQAIHYSDESLLQQTPIVRQSGDTCPWHQNGRR